VPEYFERYGFRTNPFTLRVLDPLQNKGDDQHLLRDIDGFANLDAAEQYMRERAGSPSDPADRPAFVLITGSEKSGMSSAANAVLHKYCEVRKLDGRFSAVQIEAADHSELQLYRRWIAALYNRLQPKVKLAKEVNDRFYAARKLSDLDTLDYDLQGVVADLLPALKADRGAAFGSCLEKIRTSRVVEIAKVIFENFPTLCIFTAQAGVFDVDRFVDRHSDVHVLKLGHLNSNDVSKVLEKRWGTSSPVPFHVPTLSSFCERNQHPVGVVLTVAERLLKRRVRTYEALSGQGVWPEDQRLGFTDVNTLESLQGELEVLVNGGS